MTDPHPADVQSSGTRSGDRVAKLLARAGIASRREVERMIAEGRVARDGTLIDTPNTVLSSLAGVTVDGQPVAAPAPARLFLYHKPIDLLVTERDPGGRPTIYDRLPAELPRVVPVGRLDLNTEGLLLLTTDGGLKRLLELPATGVPRTYRARAHGPVTQAQLEELIDGVEIEGIRYGSIDANLERRTGANVWIELTLTEGKNREVRRVLEHLGLQVGRLIRTRYGPFVLADLPPGEVGEVRQHDLVAFRQSLTGKRAAMTDPIVPTPLRGPRSASDAGGETAAAPTTRGGDRTPRQADRTRAAPATGRTPRPDRSRPHATDEQRPATDRPRGAPARPTGDARQSPTGQQSATDRSARRQNNMPRSARIDRDAADRPRSDAAPARRFGEDSRRQSRGQDSSPHRTGSANGPARSERGSRSAAANPRSPDRATRPDRAEPRNAGPARANPARPGTRKPGPGTPRPPRPGKPRSR